MTGRPESPARGRMTITLHSTNADASDEKAKVKIEVSNPELVAERVVTQLTRKFPPESVVTISTGAEAPTTDDESRTEDGRTEDGRTDDGRTDDGRTDDGRTDDGRTDDGRTDDGHTDGLDDDERTEDGPYEDSGDDRPRVVRLSPSAKRSKGSALSSGFGSRADSGMCLSSQYYLVTDELDLAVPISERQTSIRLFDRSTLAIDPRDVFTVFYGESGHAVGAAKGFQSVASMLQQDTQVLPLPQKSGVATFMQDFLVNDELEKAVPLCPGQQKVWLADSSSVAVNPQQVHTVAYGDRGLVIFTKDCTGAVTPRCPRKTGIAYAAVPHHVTSSNSARPISSSAAVLPPSAGSRPLPRNIHVVLYDNEGAPVCTRTPSGELSSEGLGAPDAAAHVEYFYSPRDRMQVARIRAMSDQKVTLVTGETVPVFPGDVSLVLRDRLDRVIGGLVSGRKPSLVPGDLTDIWPKAHLDSAKRSRPTTRRGDKSAPVKPASKTRTSTQPSRARTSTTETDRPDRSDVSRRGTRDVSSRDKLQSTKHGPMYSSTVYASPLNGSSYAGDYAGTRRLDQQRASTIYEVDESVDEEEDTDDQDTVKERTRRSPEYRESKLNGARAPAVRRHSTSMAAAKAASRTATRDSVSSSDEGFEVDTERPVYVDGVSRSQTYFVPEGINYAIPISPDQSFVKLANGERLSIDADSCLTVEYDNRGFFRHSVMSGGRRSARIPNTPGLGVKYQDYLVHEDLVLAVPISVGQNEVVLSDGSALGVSSAHVLSVFYDAAGKPVFTYTRQKRKIRPGLVPKPGVASSVQYLNLIDTDDGTAEQFVVPFRGHQTEIRDPRDATGKSLLPVDRKKIVVAFFDKNRQPLYSQLTDGSLVGGGLLGSRQVTETDLDELSRSNSVYSSYDFKLPYTDQPRRVSMSSVRKDPRRKYLSDSRMVNGRIGDRDRVMTEGLSGSGLLQNGLKKMPPPSEDMSIRSRRQEIIERRVPVPQVEYIEKIVEVPEVHIVDKHVEVEQIEWKTKYVKKKEIVERPVEHVKYVPKIETKIVERVIEIPQIIEVPRPEIIEQKVKVDRFVDSKKNVSVAQRIEPLIRGDILDFSEDVECLTLEPELIPVDVYVPRLVKSRLVAVGVTNERQTEVEVPLAHYNSLVLKMNPIFANNYEKLPMIKTTSGCFPLLPADQQVTVLAPTAEEITQVLKQAGVVARHATPTELARLQTLKKKSRRSKKKPVVSESDSDVISNDFAPRTSIIH